MTLHQTLHGYADGHQLVASSTILPSRDSKLMLTLSDVSGPGARPPNDGYITAYPLLESKMYALARTWNAPEMSRPGCVWTHTLLIDFADLALIADPGWFLSLFRKPGDLDIARYRAAIPVPSSTTPTPLSPQSLSFARLIVSELYSKPKSRLVAPRPHDVDVDETVLAIWAQQWPRLRRAFRFSTLSAMDRSTEGCNFDLQLYSPELRHQRAHFLDVIEAQASTERPEWLELSLNDLQHPQHSGLRAYLRSIGSDIDIGREMFQTLCNLYALTSADANQSSTFERAVEIIDTNLAAHQATAARRALVHAAINRLDHLESRGFRFLVDNLGLASQELIEAEGPRIARAIWKREPADFLALLNADTATATVASKAFDKLEPAEMIAGVSSCPNLIEPTIRYRPDLLLERTAWINDVIPIGRALPSMKADRAIRDGAIAAMLQSGRTDLIGPTLREIEPIDVLRPAIAALTADPTLTTNLAPWLSAIALAPNALATFLMESESLEPRILLAIARHTRPDSIPNDYGTDPWLTAIENAKPTSPPDLYLSTYLLTRAFGRRTRNPAELAVASFEPVYDAARDGRLPDDAWYLVEGRLPWSYIWFWDRCQRLRTGVADLFCDHDLLPRLFPAIAQDDLTFAEVVNAVARTSRGRRYLKTVRDELRQSDSPETERLLVLDAVL
ncbi:MAG: hypothetical protein WBX26_12320 [Candidatus Cybelea sp.]